MSNRTQVVLVVVVLAVALSIITKTFSSELGDFVKLFVIVFVSVLSLYILGKILFTEKPIDPSFLRGKCDTCGKDLGYPDSLFDTIKPTPPPKYWGKFRGTVGIYLFCIHCGAGRPDVQDYTKYYKPAGTLEDKYHGKLVQYRLQGRKFLPSRGEKQSWVEFGCSFKQHTEFAGPEVLSNGYLEMTYYISFCPGCGCRYVGDGWQKGLWALRLPTEISRRLGEEDIQTVEQIKDMTDEQLLAIYDIGEKSLNTIRMAVDEFRSKAIEVPHTMDD